MSDDLDLLESFRRLEIDNMADRAENIGYAHVLYMDRNNKQWDNLGSPILECMDYALVYAICLSRFDGHPDNEDGPGRLIDHSLRRCATCGRVFWHDWNNLNWLRFFYCLNLHMGEYRIKELPGPCLHCV